MASSQPYEQLAQTLARHRHNPTRLVQILREAQEELGWVAPETLSAIARGVDLPFAQVAGVASFYSFFHTEPLGRYRILFSNNITDRMRGSAALMELLCQQLWLEPGHVSEDGLVSVDVTSATGMDDQGPAMLVNYRAITRLTPQRISQIAELIRSETPVADWPPEFFVVEDTIRRRDVLLNLKMEPGEALKAAFQIGPEALIAEMKLSNLRGRGGAGFPAGQKWEACRKSPGDVRYVVCNADEGEPGTFKDRVLLTSFNDLVFEGMTLAAFAVDARHGIVYLRGEYRYLLDPLNEALAKRRAAGLLGENILGSGFSFDIEIHMGAGAYVCGERSALVESLEGKPGRPRLRTWSLSTRGYLGKPTDLNNVESLASGCLVALKGGAWYAAIGLPKSTGTKLISVSGDCERPGIYEYPFGVKVATILEDCGASNALAVQVSGPSGTTLAEDEYRRQISFEDVPCGGAFMIFDQTRDMLEVARHFAHFFAEESCGFCTPCRVGTAVNVRLMDKIVDGRGSQYEIQELYKMHRLMQVTSHCGLGSTATNMISDTMTKFRPAYERRLISLDYEPAFDLDESLSQARQMTQRDDIGAHLSQEKTS